MPLETVRIQVTLEGDTETATKFRALERVMELSMKRFLELEEEAERAGISGIQRIQLEQVQKQQELIRAHEKIMEQIGQSGLENEKQIREKHLELKKHMNQAAIAIDKAANRQITAENLKTFQKMSKTIDTFVDRWGKGAKNLGVVWDRMQNEIALGFSKFIFRLIGEWDFGLKAMQAISSRGLSGLLFAPFEKLIFGRGGGGNAALAASGAIGTTSAGIASPSEVISTAPFNPAFGGSITGTVTGIPNAQGGATQGARGAVAFGGIGALLKNPAFLQAAIGGGLTAGGLGLLLGGSPVRGALGGVLTAGGIATIAGVVLTGIAAAATLGLSAAAGIFIGSFIRGRRKRRATRIEEQFERQGLDVIDRFKKFQIAFEPALSSLEQIKLQGEQALLTSGLGRAGRRGAQTLARNIDAQIQDVTSLQRLREARLVDIQNLTLPEFAFGGPVRGINAANGALLAMLHPGEFVMRSEAVQAMGESVLATLNSSSQTAVSGPGFAAPARPITVNFNISAVDGASVARFWRQSRPQIIKAVRKAIGDRAL